VDLGTTTAYAFCAEAAPISRRLADLGAPRTGIDVAYATDILWFYFGYGALFTLQ
jgi:hypothetical protein